MIIKQEQHEEDLVEKAPSWLLSFADVSALLLAFFVMLYSMSTLKTEEYERVISKISVARDEPEKPNVNPIAATTIETVTVVPAEAPEYLERILVESLSRDPILKKSLITLIEDRIVVSLPADEVFLKGSAIITSESERAIFGLAGVMSQFGNLVIVEGHTDPTPISSEIYTSNWELSLARALAVVDLMKASGYTQKLEILGHASGQYEFLNDKIPENERKRLARRVDLVIYPESGSY